jgi:polyhydroxybutyrate depolymerase
MPEHLSLHKQNMQILPALVSFTLALVLFNTLTGPGKCSPGAMQVPDKLSLGTGDSSHSIEVGSLRRTFLVHKPEGIASGQRVPVLIAFHGGSGTAQGMPRVSRLNSLADKNKIITVYPQGIDKRWNDGRSIADRTKYDDVGFVEVLIDKLLTDPNIDPARIYLTGISNGGFMCERLVLEIPDKIAGAVIVVAGITKELESMEHAHKCVPMLFALGTNDPLVPFAGGGIGIFQKKGKVESASETAQFWAAHNHCEGKGEISELPVRDAKDPTRVKKTIYRPQAGGQEVISLEIAGGGHTWPSGPQYLPEAIVGKVCHQISNDDLWQFLSSHHL